ncbi:MAG TPA: hypothetical protein PLB38_03110 [bacterium]|nr:hypothetical protein [bacterium]
MKGKIFWLVLLMFVAFLGGAFYFMGKSDDGWQCPQVSGVKIMPKQAVDEVIEVSNKIYNGDGFTFEYSPDYILENNTLWTTEGYRVMTTAVPECETCYLGGISIGYKNDVDFTLGLGGETLEQVGMVFGASKIYGSSLLNMNGNSDYNYGYLIMTDKFDSLVYYVQSDKQVVFFQIHGNVDLVGRDSELRALLKTVKFE